MHVQCEMIPCSGFREVQSVDADTERIPLTKVTLLLGGWLKSGSAVVQIHTLIIVALLSKYSWWPIFNMTLFHYKTYTKNHQQTCIHQNWFYAIYTDTDKQSNWNAYSLHITISLSI